MPLFLPATVRSKTFALGMAGALGGIAAAVQTWAETGDWWKTAMAAGFAVWSLVQATRKDSLVKLESATVMSNLETAQRVENAVAQIAPGVGQAVAPGGATWQPFGGALLSGGIGGQMGDTFNFGSVGLGGEALPLGGAEVTRTLSWGDLPADGGGV